MEATVTTFAPFSLGGDPATAKLLVLEAASGPLLERSRSLNLEHVSAVALVRQEISRRTPLGRQAERVGERGLPVPDETVLAPLRRWFWTRKPDAGFVLTDFPATLLQAVVFDEWLDARGVALTGVLCADPEPIDGPGRALVSHYRTRGIDLWPTAAFLAG